MSYNFIHLIKFISDYNYIKPLILFCLSIFYIYITLFILIKLIFFLKKKYIISKIKKFNIYFK